MICSFVKLNNYPVHSNLANNFNLFYFTYWLNIQRAECIYHWVSYSTIISESKWDYYSLINIHCIFSMVIQLHQWKHIAHFKNVWVCLLQFLTFVYMKIKHKGLDFWANDRWSAHSPNPIKMIKETKMKRIHSIVEKQKMSLVWKKHWWIVESYKVDGIQWKKLI